MCGVPRTNLARSHARPDTGNGYSEGIVLYKATRELKRCKNRRGSLEHMNIMLIEFHAGCLVLAYDKRQTRPKPHHAMHNAEQVETWGRVLDTLTPERKQRTVKSVVAPTAPKSSCFAEVCLLKLTQKEMDAGRDSEACMQLAASNASFRGSSQKHWHCE